MSATSALRPVLPPDIRARKGQAPLVVLTAYTTPVARLVDPHCDIALVGDSVYGKQHLTPVFPRQALQARRLGLVHPATGEQCEWIVPLADDFACLIERAGIPEPEQV